MSEVDGVGPDDRAGIDALGDTIADPELALFAALYRLSLGERVTLPAAPAGRRPPWSTPPPCCS